MDKRTTTKLDEILNNIDNQKDLDNYIDDDKNISKYDDFVEYFLSLDKIIKVDKSELINRSGIERTYGYQILNKTRKPGRDKIISLCLSGKLNLNETNKALESAKQQLLYSRNKRDIIIIFSINNELSVDDTNYLLDYYHEETLN